MNVRNNFLIIRVTLCRMAAGEGTGGVEGTTTSTTTTTTTSQVKKMNKRDNPDNQQRLFYEATTTRETATASYHNTTHSSSTTTTTSNNYNNYHYGLSLGYHPVQACTLYYTHTHSTDAHVCTGDLNETRFFPEHCA